VSKRRVTIADIAVEAGVSTPTVSRVLNGRADIAPETRALIEGLLAKHEYVRRRAAKRGSVGLIDLVINELDSPWSVEIIRGVEEVVQEHGMGTVISVIHGRALETRRWLDNLALRQSDGVVLVVSTLAREQRRQLEGLGVPLVMVDPAGQPDPDIPSVGATNWAGGLAAAEHLLGLGHTRIGMIAGPPDMLCSHARIDGYRAALQRAGVTADPELVRYGDFHHETGFSGANELLGLGRPPTAIFAASDQQALGAYEALRRHGLQVPKDVSVIGFDDLPTAKWASPPLTTIRQPLAEMAAMATRILMGSIAGNEPETLRIEMATSLVVRESTAAAVG
jgi:LacI family transcriptional regulator